MTRRQGYRFRLKATTADAARLRRFLGCSRFVWNEVLAFVELCRERGEKRLGYTAMCEYLAYLKGEHPFLREVHSQPLQQRLKDLAQAYQRAFDPKLAARLPRFKKRWKPFGIRFPQGFQIDGRGVYLPKIGWMGFRKSRPIEGRPKNVTISLHGRDWYVTIQTEREVPEPVHASTLAVGIDLGVAQFAALSDGSFLDGANAFTKYEKRLAFYQRRVSRKRKFSANWRKAKSKVSRLHRKIANIRNDMLHKAGTTISKNHAVVVLEDLRVTNRRHRQKERSSNPVRMFVPSLGSIVASSIKAGASSGANSAINSIGTAVRCSWSIRVTRAAPARLAAMRAARSGRDKPHSGALPVGTRATPIPTRPPTSSLAGSGEPKGRIQAPLRSGAKAQLRSPVEIRRWASR